MPGANGPATDPFDYFHSPEHRTGDNGAFRPLPERQSLDTECMGEDTHMEQQNLAANGDEHRSAQPLVSTQCSEPAFNARFRLKSVEQLEQNQGGQSHRSP